MGHPSRTEAKTARISQIMGVVRLMGEAQSEPSLANSLRVVSEMAALLTDSEAAAVFLADEETGALRLVASHGSDAGRLAGVDEYPVAGPSGAASRPSIPSARHGESVIEEELPGTAFDRVYSVPLVVSEKTVGRLAVGGFRERLDTTAVEFLRLAGIYASTLIRNTELQSSLSRRVDALTILFDVGQALASTLEGDKVLRIAIEGVARLAGATSCSIMLLDERGESLSIRASIGIPDEVVKTAVRKIGEGIAGKVAQTGQPLFARDIHKTLGIRADENSRYRSPACICMPLAASGRVIGVLNVNDRRIGEFTQEDVYLVSLLANQAAFAIENARMHSQLWQTAVTDGLTQTFVHTYFLERLAESVARATELGGTLGLIMIDLDFFKAVNDRYGHIAGDVVLQGVASLLRRAVRANDLVARYGGEEFVLVLSDVPHRVVLGVAERLRKTIEAARFDSGGESIGVTASFGVAVLPTDAKDAESLVRFADERLYDSKRGGRNRVSCSEEVARCAAAEQEVPSSPAGNR